jgi:hypothetical protein
MVSDLVTIVYRSHVCFSRCRPGTSNLSRQMVQRMQGQFSADPTGRRGMKLLILRSIRALMTRDKYTTYLSAFVWKRMTCIVAPRVDVNSCRPLFGEVSGE